MVESMAKIRYARLSPRKARRVVDLIRGEKAGEAMLKLKFMPYRAARNVEKLLKSAMSNAETAIEKAGESVDAENMEISKVFVDAGPVMKRMMPRAMGRANVIKKRTSHITLYLTGQGE